MPTCRCNGCSRSVWDEDYCQDCDGETCCGQGEEEEEFDDEPRFPDEESEEYWDRVSNAYEKSIGY